MTSKKIFPKASERSHWVILDWLSRQKRGRILDAPAGYGHLAMRLKKMGYDVVCGEIQPQIFGVKGVECTRMDLNRDIPFPDESFDYVCCVDGLEHMTDPYRAVEEFARVLRGGGRYFLRPQLFKYRETPPLFGEGLFCEAQDR